MGWFGFGDALGAANLAVGAYGLFSGNQASNKAAKQAAAEAARVRAIADDVANEGPMFQTQYNSERARIDRDFAQNLKAMRTRANRDIARTGGVGWLTPERQDEAFASSLLRGQIDNQQMARDKARQVLLNSIGISQAAQGMRDNANTYANQARQQQLGGIQALLYGANALGGGGMKSGGTISNLWNPNQQVVSAPRYSMAGGFSGPGGLYGRV